MSAPKPDDHELRIAGELIVSRTGAQRLRPRAKGTPEPKASNRRRFERVPLDRSGALTELNEMGDPGASWPCRLVDLSRGGMGLRSRRMVHLGRLVLLVVVLGPDTPPKLLCGEVRQCRYVQGEGYVIGVLFRAPPPTATVKAWLANMGFGAAQARPD